MEFYVGDEVRSDGGAVGLVMGTYVHEGVEWASLNNGALCMVDTLTLISRAVVDGSDSSDGQRQK